MPCCVSWTCASAGYAPPEPRPPALQIRRSTPPERTTSPPEGTHHGFSLAHPALAVAGRAPAGTDVLVAAAPNAAKAFIAELPRHVRVGIVAFAGSAQLAQLPTQSREDLVKAIDSFQLQRGTATGNGIMLSLATIFPDAGIDISALGGRQAMRPKPIDEIGKQDPAKA